MSVERSNRLAREYERLSALVKSAPSENVARRTWRAMYYAGDELVSAEVTQVLRLVPGMDPYTSRLSASVTRGFTTTPNAASYLQRNGPGSVELSDIAVFLCLDRVTLPLVWRDVTPYSAEATEPVLANPVGDG